MQQEMAEEIALKSLGWIAADDDLLAVFLGATGVSIDDLKLRAADPEFLVSVLDFLTMDDAWVVGFCDASGLAYDQPMLARHALPGGAQMHWT